ncbi:MAG: bifunctional ornithine acetyltransferase/N-acetylglutamate synthase, partial [Candidatus Hadarchaeia archaeon]
TEIKGGLTAVPGFRAAGVSSGIKESDRDLLLLASDRGPVPAAGVFTSNNVKAAPVQISKKHLKDKELGGIVANSGCANAFTGREGIRNAREMAEHTAEILDMNPEDIGVASTGLIGSQLPIENVKEGIEKAAENLSNSWEAGTEAAKAIMTTDTRVKELAIKVETENGLNATIGGAAKGAGMIHPDLHATMLCFLVTDVNITPAGLRYALQNAADQSFNMLTIDGDKSTNDTVMTLANGISENERITKSSPNEDFQEALNYITRELAKMIAKDGEGASHLIEVKVDGAETKEDARKAAKAVAGSDLVKSAVHGEDPNFGRIVAALGYSGANFSPSRISISILSEEGEAPLVLKGEPLPEDTINEAEKVMAEEEIQIYVELSEGDESADAWGCDLSEEYVRINSQYRI